MLLRRLVMERWAGASFVPGGLMPNDDQGRFLSPPRAAASICGKYKSDLYSVACRGERESEQSGKELRQKPQASFPRHSESGRTNSWAKPKQ